MKVPMIFENHEVEIFEFNGKVLFNPRHVAECLDLSESALRSAVSEMSKKQVVKLTNESIVHIMDFRKLHNTGENFLTESGVYKLIFKSRKPEAERFQDWVVEEVLPSVRKTGGYRVDQISSPSSEFDMVCIGLKYTSEMLKLSNVSKLAMMSHAFDTYGLNSKALPQYAENVRPVFSATKLLSNRGKPFSASVFNAKMILAGFLEEKERTGSKGTVKTFKILTDKAVGHYGQNDVNPSNPLETQPHYFEDTFDELLDII